MSVLSSLLGSELLTTELGVQETHRARDPIPGNRDASVIVVNVDVSRVLHDVDYYVTLVVTCKLFLTKG